MCKCGRTKKTWQRVCDGCFKNGAMLPPLDKRRTVKYLSVPKQEPVSFRRQRKIALVKQASTTGRPRGSKLCSSGCGTSLTIENAPPSTVARGRGRCRDCEIKYQTSSLTGSYARRLKSPKAYFLYRTRHNAKVRNIEFKINEKDIPEIPEFCPVFPWIKILYQVGKGRSHGSASVDRIDNNVGYVKGNIRIISSRANELKRDATDKEMIALGKDAEARNAN